MPGQGRLRDNSFCPGDAHGCLACPHPCTGPATKGSPDTFCNGLPALRAKGAGQGGDTGIHTACCGPNTWEAAAGSKTVFINNQPAHRIGDAVNHCGGGGNLQTGSPNVIVGD
jgi:uncharacterized Zn-binding protein involved in type VI secretion